MNKHYLDESIKQLDDLVKQLEVIQKMAHQLLDENAELKRDNVSLRNRIKEIERFIPSYKDRIAEKECYIKILRKEIEDLKSNWIEPIKQESVIESTFKTNGCRFTTLEQKENLIANGYELISSSGTNGEIWRMKQ